MQQLNAAVAVAALAVMVLGLTSARLQTAPVSRPLLALLAGVLVGPSVLGLLRPETWPHGHVILKEAARVTLAVSVMGIALRTPISRLRRLAGPLALLLTLGMLAMWAVSAGLAWGLLGVSLLPALLIGAAMTPTDPVVASSIVTGQAAERILPDRTRSLLSLESGANDGLGYLIVLLPILLIQHPQEAWSRWLTDVVLVGVLLAVVIGAALGAAVALALRWGDRSGWIAHSSLLGLTVALSLGAVTGAKLAGSDGILAAFAAGLAFNALADRREDLEDEKVQEAIAKLFNLPIFVLLGAFLPFAEWRALGWPALALAALVLLLRRPAAMAAVMPLAGRGFALRDRVFLGWFGPVGVAAIYYALHGREATGDATVWAATSLVIAASVTAHGVTSGPGLKLYARRG